jgi:hypothetical protein
MAGDARDESQRVFECLLGKVQRIEELDEHGFGPGCVFTFVTGRMRAFTPSGSSLGCCAPAAEQALPLVVRVR